MVTSKRTALSYLQNSQIKRQKKAGTKKNEPRMGLGRHGKEMGEIYETKAIEKKARSKNLVLRIATNLPT